MDFEFRIGSIGDVFINSSVVGSDNTCIGVEVAELLIRAAYVVPCCEGFMEVPT